MTATKTQAPAEKLTYGNWQKPRSAGLFGMTFGVSMTGLALVALTFTLMLIVGPLYTGIFALVWITAMVPAVMQFDGRTGWEVMVLKNQFRAARKRRENIYHSGPFSQVPGGTYRLPGTLAPSRLYRGIDVGGREFGIVHIPRTHHHTVVFECFPQGDEAISQDQVDRYVYAWGRFMAQLGNSGDVVAAVAVIETFPETGQNLANEVRQIISPTAHPLARAVLQEAAADLPQDRVGLNARLAVTFKATTAERRRDWTEQASEIARRLPAMIQGLSDAGINADTMNAHEITAFVRRAYDPSALRTLEDASMDPEASDLAWEDAGPASATENEQDYRHDGMRSVTWEMAQAPTGAVDEMVLRRLLAANTSVQWKRVAVVFRPHSSSEAVKIVDQDFKDAIAAEQSQRGVGGAAASIRVSATSQSRQEEARGHGLVRFALLVTGGVHEDGGDVPRMASIIEDLGTQARLRLRRCRGFQAVSFAAALGCGVILPEHTTISPALTK